MSYLKWIIFCSLLVSFNNCGSHHLRDIEQTINVSSIFPFTRKAAYYHNVQIVEKKEVDGVWSYQFIASVVDADNEDSNIDIEIDILDSKGKRVCPRTLETVNRTSNHIQISACETPVDHQGLTVEVKAAPEGQSRQLIASEKFDLSNL